MGIAITVTGTKIVVSGNGVVWPANILNWLPGTLINLSGRGAYTLRTRPTQLSSTSYLFEIVESAGTFSPDSFWCNEPNIACHRLPYIWGPNAQGDVFACGDSLRPGTVYFAKSYNPDSAPQSYNLEITPPSEPLLGGEIVGGMSLVASTMRWWALYPAKDTPQQYYAVERQVGRGLIAPYGHCTDGKVIYFWGKDGIYVTDTNTAVCLTDVLYNIFPHEGVEGRNYTYNQQTVYAPDYSRASTFRLGYCNGFLYADYQDSSATYRTLVYDIALKSWCVDEYADTMSVHYGVEQQTGTILTSGTDYSYLYMGAVNGQVFYQVDLHNDGDTPITVKLATLEYNGGDARADQLWNDLILDSTPVAPITVTPIFNAQSLAASSIIGARTTRDQAIINVGTSSEFMGIYINYTEDFRVQTEPTILYLWQPLHESLPIHVLNWSPEGMGFGLPGYKFVYRLVAAYRATDDVTLTLTAYDGTSPQPITLPSTNGEYRKTLFTFTPNKGMLYFMTATSSEPWQPYTDEWELHVGQWGRPGACTIFRDLTLPGGVG